MHQRHKRRSKRFVRKTKSGSGQYHLKLVESGRVGSEMPLSLGGSTQQAHTKHGVGDTPYPIRPNWKRPWKGVSGVERYVKRLNEGWK